MVSAVAVSSFEVMVGHKTEVKIPLRIEDGWVWDDVSSVVVITVEAAPE